MFETIPSLEKPEEAENNNETAEGNTKSREALPEETAVKDNERYGFHKSEKREKETPFSPQFSPDDKKRLIDKVADSPSRLHAPLTEEEIKKREKEVAESRPLAFNIYLSTLSASKEEDFESRVQEAVSNLIEKNKKDPEIIEEINQCKRYLLKFMNEIGVEATEKRFPDNEDIYIYDELNKRDDALPEGTGIAGVCYPNEIEVLKELPESVRTGYINRGHESKLGEITKENRLQNITHELVHGACIQEVYIGENAEKQIRSGFRSAKGKFRNFNEGMTDLTSHQVLFENKFPFDHIGYPDQLIFIAALIEDMTERLNGSDPLMTAKKEVTSNDFIKEKLKKRYGVSMEERHRKVEDGSRNPEYYFSEKEILTYFQKGLFSSDRRCLKIVGDMYGKEAINALSTMGLTLNEMVKTARAFKPNDVGNRLVSRMVSYNNKSQTPINIAGQKINLNSNTV